MPDVTRRERRRADPESARRRRDEQRREWERAHERAQPRGPVGDSGVSGDSGLAGDVDREPAYPPASRDE